MPTDLNDNPARSPEILSRQTEALIMPYAVDTPVEPEQVPISEIIDRAGQVGVTSTAGEIRVEPVEEIAEQQPETYEADAPVRTLPRGHVWLMTNTPPPRRRGGGGGGGAWWYIRKYLRIPGISDKDDD